MNSFASHALQPPPAGGRKAGVDRATVVRIVHALHQAVPSQEINQSGRVARRHVQLLGQLAKRQLVPRCGSKLEEDMETPLTQAMLLGPAIHQLAGEPGGDPKGGPGFDGAQLLLGEATPRALDGLAESAVVEPAGPVGCQRAVEPAVALYLRELHNELLHYSQVQHRCQTTISTRDW